jgi:uncharacterized RDD family membrane protein YckC
LNDPSVGRNADGRSTGRQWVRYGHLWIPARFAFASTANGDGQPSPSPVPLDDALLLASYGRRLTALLLDVLVVAGIAVVFQALGQLGAVIEGPLGFAAVFVPSFLIYTSVSVWLDGQTVGKRLQGLRVYRSGRVPPSVTLRGFLWVVGRQSVGYLLTLVGGLGIPMLFERRRLFLHDKLFRSEVLRLTTDSGPIMSMERVHAYLRQHQSGMLGTIALAVAFILTQIQNVKNWLVTTWLGRPLRDAWNQVAKSRPVNWLRRVLASAPAAASVAAPVPSAMGTVMLWISAVIATLVTMGLVSIALLGPLGRNLIVNGGAEAASGAANGSVAPRLPGWTRTGNFTAIPYNSHDSEGNLFPTFSDSGPSDRGMDFFAGGPDSDVSGAVQTVDVSDVGLILDTGKVSYTLSAWLGGWQQQDDHVQLTVQFLGANGKVLAEVSLPVVLASERGGKTALLRKTASGSVPAGTRRVRVDVEMVREAGTYNDGYADDLSLLLHLSA